MHVPYLTLSGHGLRFSNIVTSQGHSTYRELPPVHASISSAVLLYAIQDAQRASHPITFGETRARVDTRFPNGDRRRPLHPQLPSPWGTSFFRSRGLHTPSVPVRTTLQIQHLIPGSCLLRGHFLSFFPSFLPSSFFSCRRPLSGMCMKSNSLTYPLPSTQREQVQTCLQNTSPLPISLSALQHPRSDLDRRL